MDRPSTLADINDERHARRAEECKRGQTQHAPFYPEVVVKLGVQAVQKKRV